MSEEEKNNIIKEIKKELIDKDFNGDLNSVEEFLRLCYLETDDYEVTLRFTMNSWY